MGDVEAEISDFSMVDSKTMNIGLLRKLDSFYSRVISLLVFTVLMLTLAVCVSFGVLLYAADFERVIFFDGSSQVCLMSGDSVIPQTVD